MKVAPREKKKIQKDSEMGGGVGQGSKEIGKKDCSQRYFSF